MNYRRHILSTLLIMAVLAWAMPAVADPPVDGTDSRSSPLTLVENQAIYAPNQAVVGFAQRSYGEALLSTGLVDRMIASLDQTSVFLYRLAEGENPEDASEALAQMTGATFAHPNYLLNELHPVQGSLAFSDQIFSGNYGDQPAARLLNLPVAHQVVTGDATVVAVIDGGIDFDHPGLDGQAASGYDFVDDDDYALDEPGGTVSGHGTFVAGVTHLVAPDAEIRAYRIMNAEGQGDGFSLAQAIERATLDECDVINVSVVLTHQHLAVQAAIEQAVARGSAVVAAAGNDATSDPIYPAAEADAISVAAIDTDLKATEFTNYGEYVDLCAPGLEVYSPYRDPYFAWWSGTSFSTPFVSGQLALLRERFRDANVAGLREIVTSTAQNLDDLNPHLPGGLGVGCINLTVALYDNCCEMVGDLDGNGITFDMADGAAMDTAFAAGNEDYLGACLGNADLTGDCRIDPYDLNLMHLAIIGDTMPYLDCSQCINYLFLPGLPGGDDCCNQVGDVNGNGIAFELGDAELLEIALNTGDADYLDPCIGNADITGDCLVDVNDLTLMVRVIVGDTMPPLECTACYSWTLVPGIPESDTAWVSPYNQAFEIPAGIDSTTPGSVYVGSTGDPRSYSVDILGEHVVTLSAAQGMTNDKFEFDVVATASMDSGLYVDTLVFDIEGIGNSPRISIVYLALGCCGGHATAHVYPYAQAFGAPPNTPHTQTGSVLVTSTNAPANFTVEVWGSDFTQLLTNTGTTNDSLSFHVTTGSGLEPGVYIDTLAFYVDGTSASPNLALLFLEVAVHDGLDSAIVHTFPGEFYALEGASLTQTGNIVVTATGLPKNFTIGYHDEPEFLHLLGSGGMTGEPTAFEVTGTAEMPPGVYIDTVIAHVDSVTNSPVLTPIYLYIDSAGSGGVGDSAWVYSWPGSFFDAPAGEDCSQPGSLAIGAVGFPKTFTVSHLNPGGFVHLHTTEGLTNASVTFDIVSTADMTPGIYVDSLIVEIVDVTNSPVLHTIFLNIESDTLVGGEDSLTVWPMVLTFQAEFGSADSLGAYIHIHSSNEPADYTAYAIGGPSSFISVPDSLGTTPDSLLILVTPEGWNPGHCTDTIVVAVDGISETEAVVVALEIVGSGYSSEKTLGLSNHPNPFNPSTEVVYTLPVDADVTLKIYNILGREVITLVEGIKTAGEHRIRWDGTAESGREVASGIYLYRLQADAASTTKKMILLR